ncbi:MAG TPA: hypothetical protein DEB25_05335 [Desulfobulbaceae bacterium]|nr:hypothetical protein [Desulfobulbaceae bacterium]
MKKSIFPAILALFLVSCAPLSNSPPEQTEKTASSSAAKSRIDPEFKAKLDELGQKPEHLDVLQVVNYPQTAAQLSTALDWLRDRWYRAEERDPRFLFSYARLLRTAKIYDSSSAAYLAGMLFARQEMTRCRDQAGAKAMMADLQKQLQEFNDLYWSLPFSMRQIVFKVAQSFVRLKEHPINKSDDPYPGVCPAVKEEQELNGMYTTMAAAAAKSDTSKVSVKKGPGGITVVEWDTSGLRFLPYEQTLAERQKVTEAFQKYYSRENKPSGPLPY